MITCTRRLAFSAGHRLMNHEGACAYLHGHNYILEVTAAADNLDPVGRVIDFSEIKKRLGGYIDEHWDHGFLFHNDDQATWAAIKAFPEKQKSMAFIFNPTAENLANHLLTSVCPFVFDGTGITVIKVKLWETENCYAEAVRD